MDFMSQLLSKDKEFYHDKGGVILGVEGMKKSMQENIYNDPKFTVRRDILHRIFKLYLMKDGNSIYGAIISGMREFFDSQNGGRENKVGSARFTNLWHLKEGE